MSNPSLKGASDRFLSDMWEIVKDDPYRRVRESEVGKKSLPEGDGFTESVVAITGFLKLHGLIDRFINGEISLTKDGIAVFAVQ